MRRSPILIKINLNTLILLFCIFLLVSCSIRSSQTVEKELVIQSEQRPLITLGSKSLTEQYLLMKMTALLLRDQGYDVKEIRFLDSPSIRTAIEEQVIDIYWEYTSTARMYYHKELPIFDPDEAYAAVKEHDAQHHLIWLDRSDFNSSWGIIVKKSFAEEHQLVTISDLIRYIKAHDHPIKFATNEEFLIREDGLEHLQHVYHFSVSQDQLIAIDSELLTLAVKEDRVHVAVGMISDSRIEEYHLTVLQDDQQAFPPYHAAPVVLEEVYHKHAPVIPVLEELARSITNEEMIHLNYLVDVQHMDLTKVAKEFLIEKGLLEAP
ncbi:glycine betaine/choline ABC-type transport system substrate-binding protein [Caldalkalibacillus uzonensis]|uniref:Glycine betaine/choline ABC-type transport system substrate-binding protein n=1 Tax=Caldalkalibacillus uzonensis TaxID=353224 RepID=A0ABU0CVW8_9BACI|nr:glycine betaine ABC transporter substrate-binding protein [Caldalkalibacillus uzonensis]MDQ0340568.1 glycine betaine/choline ABC-type transport system substrate-binding protein [Caldalkalibacillus uzonensis]